MSLSKQSWNPLILHVTLKSRHQVNHILEGIHQEHTLIGHLWIFLIYNDQLMHVMVQQLQDKGTTPSVPYYLSF
jgi:hypothetical protein